jgi:glycine cleavage system pyridoxal-binding protein P
VDELINQTVPASIRIPESKNLQFQGKGIEEVPSEKLMMDHLHKVSKKNKIYRSFIGKAFSHLQVRDTTPPPCRL